MNDRLEMSDYNLHVALDIMLVVGVISLKLYPTFTVFLSNETLVHLSQKVTSSVTKLTALWSRINFDVAIHSSRKGRGIKKEVSDYK